MKVIKIINSLGFGGIEKVFEITALYYRGDKQDIVFLSLGEGGVTERAIRNLGYKVIVWNSLTTIPKFGLIGRMVALFRAEKPDVVHTTGAEANFHGIIAAWIAGVPVRVSEEIGMPRHGLAARLGFKGVYRLASRVIAVAGLVQEFLVLSGEVRRQKVEVIYNPVNVEAFQINNESPRNAFRLVSVCRLDPIKNLSLLIRGFAKLVDTIKDRRLELWIVGEGPERGALDALVRTLGLGDSVTFWGFQANPASFLAKSSLFVLPSFSEGLPVSVAEAMLVGIPCAVTEVGGAPELIRSGENGWLFNPLDQDDFDQLIVKIASLTDRDRTAIGAAGKDSVGEMFMPDRYINSVWDLYDRAAHRPGLY